MFYSSVTSKEGQLWKERKQGNKSKENYLEATKKARKAVYQVKCEDWKENVQK